MHCHDARRLLETGVAPGTAETVRTLLGFHLAGCPECRTHRRRLDDQRLLGELMARQPEAPRPVLRPRRRATGMRMAGSAALVCGALLVGAGLRPAAAAPAAALAPRYAPGYETQRQAAYSVARALAGAPAAASREHTVYVALALAGDGAAAPQAAAVVQAPLEVAPQAELPAAAPLEIAPKAELPAAAPLASVPEAEVLADVPLVAGQELILPALPLDAPAAQPAPQRSYTVRAGDTLSGIAYWAYGNGNLWPVIWDANRESIRNPHLIYPGQTFLIPAVDGTRPPFTGTAGIYVVQPGDNLSSIALRAYGNAGAWPTIYYANAGIIGANPNLILPGQQLQLPR
jgi:nucleoid-associated protein YgaU